ncbi:carbohydrate sulfotransferase 11-like [Diadema setosum]|uniref:carbohydrate sulfotransferase 11-like n=1 Tax=Diadema setosum TaxID=31175 RepID=UPI003B3A44B7
MQLTEDEDQTKRLLQRYRSRLDRVKSACNRYGAKSRRPRDVAQDPSQFLIVDEKYKVIYCNVPKVGCSSWKSLFLTLSGYDMLHNKTLSHLGVSKSGKMLLNYVHKYTNVTHRRYVLQHYKKFLFVRHPFTRLLSAFRNKLSPESRRALIGRDDMYTAVALQIIRDLYGDARATEMSRNMSRYNMTLADFVHYLVQAESRDYDRHWMRVHDLCLPCDIDYDFIGKYETLESDSTYILKALGISIPLPRPGTLLSTNSSVPDIVKAYFDTVSTTDMKRLYWDKYFMDFKLFGYSAEMFSKMNT